jgi:imidazole glycerol-phosphate synthase subunit HisH
MTGERIVIVPTGVANLASILAGFERLGAETVVSNAARDIEKARRVVLPGVGAFAAGMRQLHADGLVETLSERVRAGRATLAVCLGMQLLFEASEESPGVVGIGAAAGGATKFTGALRVPQLGWNLIEADAGARFLEPGYAYFANSFRLTEAPSGWTAAYAEYGGPFVAALEKGDVLACQFHPELSSAFGRALLGRWLAATGGDHADA